MTYKFKSNFGNLLRLPKGTRLTKKYYRQCKKDELEFNNIIVSKKTPIKGEGKFLRLNKRILRNSKKKRKCVK
mgnify:CR=1 FL=1|tara:strand:- start:127 stop:345 length:219 start_codon:yes stop_codon:yes gene_type:complete